MCSWWKISRTSSPARRMAARVSRSRSSYSARGNAGLTGSLGIVDEAPGVDLDQQLLAGEALDDDPGLAGPRLPEVAPDDRIGGRPVAAIGHVDDHLDDVRHRAAGHLHQ